ncbi:MAG: arginase family protein, partial [Longimicrobiales bacterium]
HPRMSKENLVLALDVVTVPYDSGRRGFRMGAGPQALLREGLVQKLRAAGRDVELVPVESTATANDELSVAFDLAARVARVTRASRSAHRFPLTLSGSCFTTVGAFAGCGDDAAGVLWFDAHGDLNTPETSPGGFLDGMAAAALLGWCHTDRSRDTLTASLNESKLMLAGTRDLDEQEGVALQRSAVTSLSPADVRDHVRLAAALDAFAAPLSAIYLHVDLDVLDPAAVGRANSFAAPDGMTLSEVIDTVRAAGARSPIAGMTISAYDPAEDTTGAVRRAAIEIIAAALATAESVSG